MSTRAAGPAGLAHAPRWAAAYGSQAAAAWLVVRGDARNGEYDVPAFTAFTAQLGLSVAWLLLFFRFRRPAFALADMCLLWLAVAVTVREFARKHRLAAGLLLPYLGWVTYAAAVNAQVWWRER
ncbi:MAG: translocator protein [Frankiaceae bacterium]|jgi:tryptophan-rich sensory protein|nr:translocator protein [Frankiaceae bacterium]